MNRKAHTFFSVSVSPSGDVRSLAAVVTGIVRAVVMVLKFYVFSLILRIK